MLQHQLFPVREIVRQRTFPKERKEGSYYPRELCPELSSAWTHSLLGPCFKELKKRPPVPGGIPLLRGLHVDLKANTS